MLKKKKKKTKAKVYLNEIEDIRGKLFRCIQDMELMDYDTTSLPLSAEGDHNVTGIYVADGGVVLATGRVITFIEETSKKRLLITCEYEVLFGTTVGWLLKDRLRSAKSWKGQIHEKAPLKKNEWQVRASRNRFAGFGF